MADSPKTLCKQRCVSWFPEAPQLWGGCNSYCDQNQNFTKCDYLENVLGDTSSIQYFGLDCDPTKGQGSKLLVAKNAAMDFGKNMGIVTLVVIIAIFILWFFYR